MVANGKGKNVAANIDIESEDDDDSPYFVKITLDEVFLSHLEMPDIVSSNELEGRFRDLVENSVFKHIIQREISMMFGAPEVAQKDGGDGTESEKNEILEPSPKAANILGSVSPRRESLDSSTSSKRH